MAHSVVMPLPNKRQIRLVSAPYFLISKLDAFDGRGKGDYLTSHDIEDVIAVLDGRREIVEEIKRSEPMLVHELSKRFQGLLNDSQFVDAVSHANR